MPLTDREIASLLERISLTSEQEIGCDQCLLQLAEFAERELVGKSIPESLATVVQHLAICDECQEEYQALLRALQGTDD